MSNVKLALRQLFSACKYIVSYRICCGLSLVFLH